MVLSARVELASPLNGGYFANSGQNYESISPHISEGV